jgi:hypothetical protein
MKNLLLTLTLLTFASVATAKDICIRQADYNPEHTAYYKFKMPRPPKGGAVRITGVAVYLQMPSVSPGYVEGSAIRLDNGGINYYLNPIGRDGVQIMKGVEAIEVSNNHYYGIFASNNAQIIDCKLFPAVANQ